MKTYGISEKRVFLAGKKITITTAKAFYFFFFAAMVALTPFLVLYYEQLGFSGQQIGILSAIFPLMMLVSAPFWGMIADVTKRHKVVLISLIGLAIVFGLTLTSGRTFPSLVLLLSVYTFFAVPIGSLADTAVMASLGERKSDYGRSRVWGAVGWGISAPIVGIFTERLGISWAFYSYALLMLFCLFSASRLSFAGLFTIGKECEEEQRGGAEPFNSLKQFLTLDWVFFLAAIFVAGIGLSVSGSFVYLRLSELQATGFLVGLALTTATLSELPLTFYGKQLLNRFSTLQLVFAAMIIVGLRLVLYGFATASVQILLIQLLHGFCFSILFIAGIAYADAHAPEGKNATAQGLFSGVLFGLGSAAGGLLGGYFYDSVGASQMFRLVGLSILLASAVLMVIHYVRKNLRPTTAINN